MKNNFPINPLNDKEENSLNNKKILSKPNKVIIELKAFLML